MAYVNIHLPYFKQGDDLAHCLNQAKDNHEAFLTHAELLRAAAEQLNNIASIIKGHKIRVTADTHMIMVECDEDLAQQLVDAELAEFEEDILEPEEGDVTR